MVGTTGSGKTTLARAIAGRLGLPHAEQDGWNHLSGWREASLGNFRAAVEAFTAGHAWVLDGNYRKAQDIGWARADTLIWLDYPAPLVFWRLLGRTLRRAWKCEELWNGNRESSVKAFLSRQSILLWFFSVHWRLRREMPGELAAYPHLRVLRFRHPEEAEGWLETLWRPGLRIDSGQEAS